MMVIIYISCEISFREEKQESVDSKFNGKATGGIAKFEVAGRCHMGTSTIHIAPVGRRKGIRNCKAI